MTKIKELIRDIEDYPKKGIIFKDITTLLKDPKGLKDAIDYLVKPFENMDIDYVVGAESRGFIFGAVIAYKLNAGFVPIRKPGKLPSEVYSVSYDLEYGKDSLEMHKDAIEKGKNVLVVDDLLATGGTASAMVELMDKVGANISGIAFLIELEFLKGKEKLEGHEIFSVIKY